MKFTRQILIGVVTVSPALGLATACDSNQEIPLAKVTSPPPLPAQDKSKIKAPAGHSPDVLPQY
jgi:hypothetical protein